MNKMYANWLLMGVFIGVIGALIIPKIYSKPETAPILAEKISIEKHAKEVAKPKHTVQAKGKVAVFTYTVPTEHYGLIKGDVQASRSALQYKHRFSLGTVILNTSVLGRAAYAYKNVEFSLYGGYDFKQGGTVFGAGLGYSWGF